MGDTIDCCAYLGGTLPNFYMRLIITRIHNRLWPVECDRGLGPVFVYRICIFFCVKLRDPTQYFKAEDLLLSNDLYISAFARRN